MIHVAITCALNSASTGRFCPALEDNIRPEDAPAWHAATIAEHGWTMDADGYVYCPRHNPNDAGTPVALTSEGYLPIGESGWEARVPHNPRCDISFANIEIRPIREAADG